MSLVQHVCKETVGLDSLFLISKSNCAFANFKDEPTCTKAQQQLHDSKFKSVRLVSRLRKSTVEGASGVTAPTGPAAATPQLQPLSTKQHIEVLKADVEEGVSRLASPVVSSDQIRVLPGVVREEPIQQDKFFILKSLTVEDLQLSVRTHIWATQSHNEDTLNSAFRVSLHNLGRIGRI
jgi:hypothetical protein